MEISFQYSHHGMGFTFLKDSTYVLVWICSALLLPSTVRWRNVSTDTSVSVHVTPGAVRRYFPRCVAICHQQNYSYRPALTVFSLPRSLWCLVIAEIEIEVQMNTFFHVTREQEKCNTAFQAFHFLLSMSNNE